MSDSLKQRAEYTLIMELRKDPVVRAKCPVKQNEDTKLKLPSVTVNVTPGNEYQVGAGIYRMAAAIEVRVSAKRQGQTTEVMDDLVKRIRALLVAAQARGEYGLTMDGEPTTFEEGAIRKRVINVGLIAA